MCIDINKRLVMCSGLAEFICAHSCEHSLCLCWTNIVCVGENYVRSYKSYGHLHKFCCQSLYLPPPCKLCMFKFVMIESLLLIGRDVNSRNCPVHWNEIHQSHQISLLKVPICYWCSSYFVCTSLQWLITHHLNSVVQCTEITFYVLTGCVALILRCVNSQSLVHTRLLWPARLVLTHFLQPTSYKSMRVDVVMGRSFDLRTFSVLSNCASSGTQQLLPHWYKRLLSLTEVVMAWSWLLTCCVMQIDSLLMTGFQALTWPVIWLCIWNPFSSWSQHQLSSCSYLRTISMGTNQPCNVCQSIWIICIVGLVYFKNGSNKCKNFENFVTC